MGDRHVNHSDNETVDIRVAKKLAVFHADN